MKTKYICNDCFRDIPWSEYQNQSDIFCSECGGKIEEITEDLASQSDSNPFETEVIPFGDTTMSISPYEIAVKKAKAEKEKVEKEKVEIEEKERMKRLEKSNLATCVNCHSSISKRAEKCPKCGVAITNACGICKNMILRSVDVCPECGDPDPFGHDLVKLNANNESTFAKKPESNKAKVSQQSEISYTIRESMPTEPSKGPKGVGGWLSFLIAQLMIIGPIFGAAKIFGYFYAEGSIYAEESIYYGVFDTNTWNLYKALIWLAFVVTVVISFSGGWRLMRRSDRSVVQDAKVILWIVGPVALVVSGLIIPMVCFGKEVVISEFIDLFMRNMFGVVIATFVWTLYLSKSKRVRNTYNT